MASIDYQYIAERIPIEVLKPLLSDDELNDIKLEKVENIIIDAESEVDNALARVYVYPYQKSDDILGEKSLALIRRWKFVIARQLIYSYKFDDEDMKEVNAHHSAVLQKLSAIVKGEEELLGLARKVASSPLRMKSSKNKSVFSQKSLKRYDP